AAGEREGADIRDFTDFGRDLQRDAVFGEDDRGEGKAAAILLELDGHVAIAFAAGRYREFTAGEEFRRFTRHRGEVRLGEGVNKADFFEGLELSFDVGATGTRKR